MHAAPTAAVHAQLTNPCARPLNPLYAWFAVLLCLPPDRSQFSSLSKTSSTTQTITTNSGAQVYLGGISLGAGKQALGRS